MTLAYSMPAAESNVPVAAAHSAATAIVSPRLRSATSSETQARAARRPAAETLPEEICDHIRVVYNAQRYDEAATVCVKLLRSHRNSPFLWTQLGLCHMQRNQFNDALTCLNRARELAPETAAPLTGMADVYACQNRLSDAEDAYRAALALDPTYLPSLNNYGTFLSRTGRSEAALEFLENALSMAPDSAALLYNLANTRRELGQHEIALPLYQRALDVAPMLSDARQNLYQLLSLEKRYVEAIAQCEILLEQNPEDDNTRAQHLHMLAMLNDFSWVKEYRRHRRHLGLRGTPVTPFATLSLEDNPDLLRVRTHGHANSIFAQAPAAPIFARPEARPERLRIGYFSADFHAHATMHLMGGLLREHDKSRFEIHAFSYGPHRDDAQRALAEANVDHFHELGTATDAELIACAQAQQLDIAVDLKGYTGFNRASIFGAGLAPVQISYLGYPGTMGTPHIDYIVTDSIVSPAGSERHFEEHLLRLPHSYQPNDNRRIIAARQFTRADCDLPEDGFIFCCLNNSYKITPREFDIWMRLLATVEGSVLWLLSGGPEAEANLRKEARARGIDAARLIFAQRMPQDEHLARQKVADLFLDTFAVNAHTTCSDALWAGLPVLTLPGEQFAARVAASLLTAVGLPELIATSETDYEEKALHLAQNPDALLALRSKLMVNRRTAPLFDTRSYTRHLETAFEGAWTRWQTGESPTHITVEAEARGSTADQMASAKARKIAAA